MEIPWCSFEKITAKTVSEVLGQKQAIEKYFPLQHRCSNCRIHYLEKHKVTKNFSHSFCLRYRGVFTLIGSLSQKQQVMWQKERQIVSRKHFRMQGPALQIPTQAALVGTGGSARCRKLRKLHRLEYGAIHRNLRSRLHGRFTFKLNFPTEIKPILWK